MAIKTILCVEDDRFIGEMYVRSLQKAGYDVTWVVDGNDGLVMARSQPFDLIILDLMLPEQRGDQILDALRSDDTDLIPESKILIMTNFEQDDATKSAIMNRVDGYLIKADITPRKLIDVVNKMG
ncbi:response regulator [Candidatus Saccharibacteria bacterium oral taxon 488]|jgi:response regulator receiver protein|nr:response regulator [Candidatus Saccharibacteria bacterium]MBF1023726.1 response regulator [Candidatus Nanogingivalaceae bacterium]QHU90257.1 response regulator [Candidatus Saccharibacteria bacterium oral taxon 488]QJU04952.1 response regulator [Candidatus Saccharibacteria bacterium oral taxon 488]QJU07429.1 response regulator [Candidatus Saccharibacteria bacterium oral taxon 488]